VKKIFVTKSSEKSALLHCYGI